MVRKLAVAVAATLAASTALAQGPMHDTWDINAPNGEQMTLSRPLPSYTGVATSSGAPMHDTWDINAPNGAPTILAAGAPAAQGNHAVHGHVSTAARADRVIEVRPGMRYVNVTSGETVLFKVGDKSFAWTFDATLDHPSFDLSQIAPEGFPVQSVRIYCAPDQYERAS